MRILNWNISHGGGARITAICCHIEQVNPDLLVFTEFRLPSEALLRAELKRLGYPFIVTSNPAERQNGLLIASKWQIDRAAGQPDPDTDRERWLAIHLDELDLEILVLHIPGAPDNKFADGYGISGAKRKELFWEHVVAYASEHQDRRAILMGDFNTGFRIDAEGAMFKKSHYMKDLIDTGFVDVWRQLHPDAREYTWYSKRKDKQTGLTEDFNGFRLDYIFVSPALRHAISDAAIRQEPRRAGASDHASVVATLDLGELPASQEPMAREATAATDSLVSNDVRSEMTGAVNRRMEKPISPMGNHRARFILAPRSLPDMACGVNGQAFVQRFRPAYVTAEWANGVLKEVRIWGRRVLQDGSLGKRELDHVWKQAAGVNYNDLPPSVAVQLRSYIAGDDLRDR